jgi:hypothetical protein
MMSREMKRHHGPDARPGDNDRFAARHGLQMRQRRGGRGCKPVEARRPGASAKSG